MAANDFVTQNSGAIAQVALEQLYRQLVLPNLVWKDVSRDFKGGVGNTVSIPVPATLAARRYTDTLRQAGTAIVLDAIDESGVDVVINTHSYSAVPIPDEDAVLNVRDFARQVLAPQMMGVAEDVETGLASTFTGLANTNDITVPRVGGAGGDKNNFVDPALKLIDAATFLTNKKVPMANRFLVMGANFAGVMLADNRISRYDGAGDNTALQSAQFQPIFGFTPYVSLAVPSDQAFAFTREAVALATVTPTNPRGANASETVTANGVTMRWLSDYDPAFLRDRSIVSVLSGSAIVDANRIVRMKLAAAT